MVHVLEIWKLIKNANVDRGIYMLLRFYSAFLRQLQRPSKGAPATPLDCFLLLTRSLVDMESVPDAGQLLESFQERLALTLLPRPLSIQLYVLHGLYPS